MLGGWIWLACSLVGMPYGWYASWLIRHLIDNFLVGILLVWHIIQLICHSADRSFIWYVVIYLTCRVAMQNFWTFKWTVTVGWINNTWIHKPLGHLFDMPFGWYAIRLNNSMNITDTTYNIVTFANSSARFWLKYLWVELPFGWYAICVIRRLTYEWLVNALSMMHVLWYYTN